MQPKFEFTDETTTVMGHTLKRIRALRSFGGANAGDLGGWIEKEENLSHERNSWVYDDAQVSGDAQVYDDAQVYGGAWVFGGARVYGGAQICNQRHIDVIPHIGSRNGTTTFFRTADSKIWVNCGCFSGDIDRFAAAVKKTHGNNKHAQDYAAAIARAKAWIDLSGEEPDA
ncbi:hypothetical protein D3Z48_08925 [Clostridiaceae bacterium]|nr:hypothetical protein [Clostridiaceae bacterium]